MIPVIHKSGRSFKDAAQYLTHDPKAQTSERVAWTHTENLANDHVPSAVDEMLWTYRGAETLKQQAGIRAGGRPTQYPVKHVSLNWDPADNPSKEHLIETGRHFINRMGWGEHQAIFVAHDDKDHKHIHILVNAIHPETGKVLKQGWEHNRASKWAADYEQANGVIRVPQRFLHSGERDPSMPRNIWQEFRNNELEFEKSEQQFRKEFGKEYAVSDQWEIFKGIQKAEREAFYAEGKAQFKELRNEVYRGVREEFKSRWADYYGEKKKAKDPSNDHLAQMKTQISADQSELLKSRRELASDALFAARQAERVELKLKQQADRAEFRDRIATGLDNAEYFKQLFDGREVKPDVRAAFRDAAAETTLRVGQVRPLEHVRDASVTPEVGSAERPHVPRRDVADIGAHRAVASVGSFLDALFYDITTLGSARPEPEMRPDRDYLEVAAEEATKTMLHDQQQAQEQEPRDRIRRWSYGE